MLGLTDTTGTTTFTGPAAGVTISSGGGSDPRVFKIGTGVSAALSGLTITGGKNDGVFNLGTLTMANCTVSGNSSGGNGGGLLNSGTLTMTDCTISGNSLKSTDRFGNSYNDPYALRRRPG